MNLQYDSESANLRSRTRILMRVVALSMNRNPEVGWIKRSGSTTLTIVHGLSSVAPWRHQS